MENELKGNLIIRKSKKWELGTNRCRNCVHFGKGYTTRYGPHTTVCLNSPKTLKSHNKLVYYAAKPLEKACDMFEPRDDNDGETNNS